MTTRTATTLFACITTALFILNLLFLFQSSPASPTHVAYSSTPSRTQPSTARYSSYTNHSIDFNYTTEIEPSSRRRAFIVTGLESSGTKEVSKIIAHVVHACRYSTWDGHEVCVDKDRGNLVVHRSLPHGEFKAFNNVSHIAHTLQSLGYQTDVVVVTRDETASLKSKLVTHQPDPGLALEEHRRGTHLLKKFIHDQVKQCNQQIGSTSDVTSNSRCFLRFVFSYESYILLRRTYLELLLAGLRVDISKVTAKSDVLSIPSGQLKDGNKKYFEACDNPLASFLGFLAEN